MKSKSKRQDQRRSGNRSSRRQEEPIPQIEDPGLEPPPQNRTHPPVPSCVIRLGPQRRDATIYRPSDRLVDEDDDDSCRIISSTGPRDGAISKRDVTTSQCDVIMTNCESAATQSCDKDGDDCADSANLSTIKPDKSSMKESFGNDYTTENNSGESISEADRAGISGAEEESGIKRARVCLEERSIETSSSMVGESSDKGDNDDDVSGISDKELTSLEMKTKRNSSESPTEKTLKEDKMTEPARCNQSVSTDPDLLGPCDPGSAVVLEGIVWNESRNGLLVVNVTWRGKTYVGTLMDSSAHQWASPSFRDDFRSLDPSNGDGTSGEGRRLRRGCRAGTASARSSTVSRSSKRTSEPASPASKSPQSSGSNSEKLLSCPEPMCDKKFKHRGALTTHRQRSHKYARNSATAAIAENTTSTEPISDQTSSISENSTEMSETVSSVNGIILVSEKSLGVGNKITILNRHNGSNGQEAKKTENIAAADQMKSEDVTEKISSYSSESIACENNGNAKIKNNPIFLGPANSCQSNANSSKNCVDNSVKIENHCKTETFCGNNVATDIKESKCCNVGCKQSFECKLESGNQSLSAANFIKHESVDSKPSPGTKSVLPINVDNKCCIANNINSSSKERDCDIKNDLVKCDLPCVKKPKMDLDWSDKNGCLADAKVACMPGNSKTQTPVVIENHRSSPSENRGGVLKLKDESSHGFKMERTSTINYIDNEPNQKIIINGSQSCKTIHKGHMALDLKSSTIVKAQAETSKELNHFNCKGQCLNLSSAAAKNTVTNCCSLSVGNSSTTNIANITCGPVDVSANQSAIYSIPVPDKIQFPLGNTSRNSPGVVGKTFNEKPTAKQVNSGCAKCKAISATQEVPTNRWPIITSSANSTTAAMPLSKSQASLTSLKMPIPMNSNVRGSNFSAVVNMTEIRLKTPDFCQMCPSTNCLSGIPTTGSDLEKTKSDFQNGAKSFFGAQKSWSTTAPSRTCSSMQCLTESRQTSYSMPGSNQFTCMDSNCLKNTDHKPQSTKASEGVNAPVTIKQTINPAFPVCRGIPIPNYAHVPASGIEATKTTMHNTARNPGCAPRDMVSLNVPITANLSNTHNIPNTAYIPITSNAPITGLSLLSAMSSSAAQHKLNAAHSMKQDSTGEFVKRLGNEAEFTKSTAKSSSGSASGCCVPLKSVGEVESNKNSTKLAINNTLGCCVPSLYTDTKTQSCITLGAPSSLPKDILPTPLSCTVGAAAVNR